MKLDEGYYQNLKEGKNNYYSDNFPDFLEDKEFQDHIDFETSSKDLHSYNTTEQRILVSTMYKMNQNSDKQKICSFMATLLSGSSQPYGIGLARVFNDLYESEKIQELTNSSTEAIFVVAPDYKTTKSELKMIEDRKIKFDRKLKNRMRSIKALYKYINKNVMEIFDHVIANNPSLKIEKGIDTIDIDYHIADSICLMIIRSAAKDLYYDRYLDNVLSMKEQLSKYRGL